MQGINWHGRKWLKFLSIDVAGRGIVGYAAT